MRHEKETQLPRNWSALYQQRPAPETGDYFKAEWFRTYTSIGIGMAVVPENPIRLGFAR